MGAVIGDSEICEVMLAGKEASAREMVEPGACVSAWDKHTLAGLAGRLIPEDGDTVGGVLTGDTEEARKPPGPNLLQPDKTDASDSITIV